MRNLVQGNALHDGAVLAHDEMGRDEIAVRVPPINHRRRAAIALGIVQHDVPLVGGCFQPMGKRRSEILDDAKLRFEVGGIRGRPGARRRFRPRLSLAPTPVGLRSFPRSLLVSLRRFLLALENVRHVMVVPLYLNLPLRDRLRRSIDVLRGG